MIAIICAMKEELEQIKILMQNSYFEKAGPFGFTFGEIGGKKCVLTICGVGKVSAAMCAQALIDKYNPKLIINVGVAGSIDENVKIGDVIICSAAIQHDFDISAFPGRKKGEISGINKVEINCTPWIVSKFVECAKKSEESKFHVGTLLTGDQFISSISKLKNLKKDFGGLACEMEAGSIAQVCYLNNIEFAILRAISDCANKKSSIDFYSFIKSSSKNAASLLYKFIKSISD